MVSTSRATWIPPVLGAGGVVVAAGGVLDYLETCAPQSYPPCPYGTPCPPPGAYYCLNIWTPLAVGLVIAGALSFVAAVAVWALLARRGRQ